MHRKRHNGLGGTGVFRTHTTTHVTSFETLERAIQQQRQLLIKLEMQEKQLRSKVIAEKIKFSSHKENLRSKTEGKLNQYHEQWEGAQKTKDRLTNEIAELTKNMGMVQHKIKVVQHELNKVNSLSDSEVGKNYKQQVEDIVGQKNQVYKELTAMYQELQQIFGVVQNTVAPSRPVQERAQGHATAAHRKEISELLHHIKETLPKEIQKGASRKQKVMVEQEPPEDQEEVRALLKKLDSLLLKLPEDEISNFAQSHDFELYKKIMGKYNVK